MIAKDFGPALALFLLSAGSAGAQTTLAWKFTPGQVFQAARTTRQKQTVEIKGKLLQQERSSSWNVLLEVQQSNLDGFRIRAVLSRVEQQLTGASAPEIIDPKLAEKMQGSAFILHVTPQGRIVTLNGYEDFLNKVSGNDKTRLKALRITFPEESIKEVFADLFGPLPEKKVVPKDAWERVQIEPIPHFGTLRSTIRYVYAGSMNQRERIQYTLQTMYELPRDDSVVLFRIVKGNIQGENGRGAIVFDAAAGHLLEHERSLRLRGTLTIDVMDRQQPLEFTSENEVKIRVEPGR